MGDGLIFKNRDVFPRNNSSISIDLAKNLMAQIISRLLHRFWNFECQNDCANRDVEKLIQILNPARRKMEGAFTVYEYCRVHSMDFLCPHFVVVSSLDVVNFADWIVKNPELYIAREKFVSTSTFSKNSLTQLYEQWIDLDGDEVELFKSYNKDHSTAEDAEDFNKTKDLIVESWKSKCSQNASKRKSRTRSKDLGFEKRECVHVDYPRPYYPPPQFHYTPIYRNR